MKFLFLIILFVHSFIQSSPTSVPQGGTGKTTFTAYAVLCGGTSTTNPVQNIASAGTAGQVLKSGGAAALPSFVDFPASMELITTLTASSSSSLIFTSANLASRFSTFLIMVNAIVPASNSCYLRMDWSTNDGLSYISTNYRSGINYKNYNSAGAYSNSSSTSSCVLSYAGGVTGDEGGVQFCALMWLLGLNATSAIGPSYYGQSLYFNATPTAVTGEIFGFNTGSLNVNNIRFTLIDIPGGTTVLMSSGSISLYGIV